MSRIYHLDTVVPLALSGATVLALLGTALLLVLALWTYSSWSRLRHIPGPPSAGLSKWWMFRSSISGNMHLALKDVVDKYGKYQPKPGRFRSIQGSSAGRLPVPGAWDPMQSRRDAGPLARIGPNTLVTNDPDVLRKLWAVRSPYKKGPFYQAVRFNPDRDNLISMRDDDEHRVLRSKMAAGYAGKDVDSLEAVIDKGISAFIRLVERRYVSEPGSFRPMDLARKVQYAALDIIGLLSLGERFGFTDEDTDVHQYIKILEESMPVMITLTVFPTLAKVLQSRLCRRLMPSERDKIGLGVFIGVAKQIVTDRLASGNPCRGDMLGSFLAHGLTREEAEGEMLLQIVAGSDTTATAVRTTMLYMLSSPNVYGRLTAELPQQPPCSSPPATNAECLALPYLQAVIKEGMRMHPPVAGLMGVMVPPGGDVLCGLGVPGGTEVGWSVFALQRREDVYGDDAGCFRPERWLEADGGRLRAMEATWDLIFKYGKWQCLGKPVALIEINKLFVELLRRYDFALVDAAQPMKSANAGIFLQSGLIVKITRAQ
ncbi:hypothetical protein GGTG_04083 [Gaeumannomyces tritici R3-111a-1]|uniref:Pisatin demethylase n=1 Tax=Gaeumannomyces tritici (strain R3-111a-1) TaxID=644352 RepID=J3NS36_GAET3|nr:hypothetical protein GGTG_04083 [Gaeumannomyces tritici R3-111a-1]EJT78992.1 hypothetical protein GGTG_04083 [Gaeumannomyces tritici R3-111a-1]